MSVTGAIALALLHSLWIGALVQGLAWALLHIIAERQARLRAAIVTSALYSIAISFAAMATVIAGDSPSSERLLLSPPHGYALDVLFTLWCVGLTVSSLRLGRDLVLLRTLVAASRPTEDRALLRVFENLCHDVGGAVQVRLRTTTDTLRPCVIGIVRPVVLIPVSCLSRLSTEEVEAVLAHELAHILRHDVLHAHLIAGIRSALFFNPFVQSLGRRHAVECERACDDLAASWLSDRRNLATAILKLGLLGGGNAFALSSSGRSGPAELQNRAQRLVYASRLSYVRRSRGRSVLTIATALFFALGAWALAHGLLAPPAESTLADRSQLIALKRAVCDVLETDRIYANPLYYSGGEAVLLVTEDAVRMRGQALPKDTDRSLRRIFARFGADKSDLMHLRYLGTRIRLTMSRRTAEGGFRRDVFSTSPREYAGGHRNTAI